MLAIGRALVRQPKILLLDEPFEGLAPVIVHDLLATCRALADASQTILLVEQNIAAAMTLADRIYGHIVDSMAADAVRVTATSGWVVDPGNMPSWAMPSTSRSMSRRLCCFCSAKASVCGTSRTLNFDILRLRRRSSSVGYVQDEVAPSVSAGRNHPVGIAAHYKTDAVAHRVAVQAFGFGSATFFDFRVSHSAAIFELVNGQPSRPQRSRAKPA